MAKSLVHDRSKDNRKVSFKDFVSLLFNSKTKLELNSFGRTKLNNNWMLGPRKIDDHLLFYFEKGNAQIQINNNSYELNTHQLLWVQPNVKHKIEFKEVKQNSINIFIRFSMVNSKTIRLKEDFLLSEIKPDYYKDLALVPFFEKDKSFYLSAQKRAFLALLLCKTLKNYKTKPNRHGLSTTKKQIIMDYIFKNINNKIKINDLANIVQMNQDYFSRMFKKTFNTSPQNFIKEQRMHQAQCLLSETTLNISEIANELGFIDIYHFSHQFKEVMGVSPNTFRKSL